MTYFVRDVIFYSTFRGLSVTYLTVKVLLFFFSSRRRHTRCSRDWSSDVCSSDLRGDRLRAQEGQHYARCLWRGQELALHQGGHLGQRGVQLRRQRAAGGAGGGQIGRASCRERV